MQHTEFPTPEWVSIKLYRFLTMVYIRLLRIIAGNLCQKYLTLIAVLAMQGIGFTCLIVKSFIEKLPGGADDITEIMWFNIFLLTLTYFYSIKAIYEKRKQNKVIIVIIHVLSFSLFFQHFLLVALLKNKEQEEFRSLMITMLLLHLLVVYYLLWVAPVLVVGVLFVLESWIRVLTFKWTSPCSSNTKLFILFYPILPTLFNESMLIPESYFSSQESSTNVCIVCLIPFNTGDTVKQLTCHPTHIFHNSCLQQWVNRKSACPICRHPL